ncbi:MAG: cytochrome c3 family protein [Candidatus Krumholzibacteriia bacterium]
MSVKVLIPRVSVHGFFVSLMIAAAATGSGATFPSGRTGDATCVECHEDAPEQLRRSPHRATLDGDARRGAQVHCESCHGAGQAHAEDPTESAMPDLAALPSSQANRACLGCHALPIEEGALQHQHLAADLRCIECHAIHSGTPDALLRKTILRTCLGCHPETAHELRQVSHHPVLEGRLDCSTCHLGSAEVLSAWAPDGTSARCVTCHTEHEPLALHEHTALNDAALEGEGCTVCHAPHGSAHARLLRRPGDALCLQCHAVPGHATAHDGAYAGRRCLECHVDVHGSFSSATLLHSQPLDQNCPVCHDR